MSYTLDEMNMPEPIHASVEGERLRVDLADGRTIIVPISLYPRLVHSTPAERNEFELDGMGLNWPEINECVSVAMLLAGTASSEGEKSFGEWLRKREAGESVQPPSLPLPDWWDDPIEQWPEDRSELKVDSAAQTA